MRRTLAVLLATLTAATLASCTSSQGSNKATDTTAGDTVPRIQGRGELRVGVDQGKPLVFKDASGGEWQGVYIDAIQRWADTMKVKLVFVPTTFANMVAGLQADKFDVAVALNPTPERSLSVVFSQPLTYEIDGFAVDRASGLTSYDQLNASSRKICVPLGSAPDIALTAAKPKAAIQRLKSESDCELAITNKRADAFFWAAADLTSFASSNSSIGIIFPPTPFLNQGTAFGLNRSTDYQSLDALNIQLADFINNGGLAASEKRYNLLSPKTYAIGTVPAYVQTAG